MENPSSSLLLRFQKKCRRPGVCGLENSGNSCYLNAVLQCLSATVPLVEQLLHWDTRKGLARYHHFILNNSDVYHRNFSVFCVYEGLSAGSLKCLCTCWRKCGWEVAPAVALWRSGQRCAPSSPSSTTTPSKTHRSCCSFSSTRFTTTSTRCS